MSVAPSDGRVGSPGVTVIVASNRPAVVAAWLARIAGKPGLAATGSIVGDPEALDAALGRAKAGVAFLDVATLEWLGEAGLRRLRTYHSGLRVLLVCESAGPHLGDLVLDQRLDGYLTARDGAELCVKAIFAVIQGEVWLPRATLTAALRRLRNEDRGEAKPVIRSDLAIALTERERQVANCLRKGASNTEIARELVIKKETVKKHVRRVLRKFGVQRRTEVALLQEPPKAQKPPADQRIES